MSDDDGSVDVCAVDGRARLSLSPHRRCVRVTFPAPVAPDANACAFGGDGGGGGDGAVASTA